jgi:hypothetical protein
MCVKARKKKRTVKEGQPKLELLLLSGQTGMLAYPNVKQGSANE